MIWISESVRLSWSELRLAAYVGVNARLIAIRDRLPDKFGDDADAGWQVRIEGAIGEIVLAKATGRYWTGMDPATRRAGDVGRLEARFGQRSDHGLLVRPKDHDERAFVLVTVTADPLEFALRGWMTAGEAKQVGNLLETADHRAPCWIVPQSLLRPLSEIPNERRP